MDQSEGTILPFTSVPLFCFFFPKMSSRGRRWVFTLNNYTVDEELELTATLSNGAFIRFACYSHEVGESGTPHLQGYVAFLTPQRFRTSTVAVADPPVASIGSRTRHIETVGSTGNLL